MTEKLINYYAGDEFAAGVWLGKYAVINKEKVYQEETPDDFHHAQCQHSGAGRSRPGDRHEFRRQDRIHRKVRVNRRLPRTDRGPLGRRPGSL